MLTDWEKDIWTRVYLSVDRRSVVNYTFDRQQATAKKFVHSLGKVEKTLFRTEVKQERKNEVHKDEVSSRVSKEPGTPSTVSAKPRRLSIVETSNEYHSDTEIDEKLFYLRLMSEKNQEVA